MLIERTAYRDEDGEIAFVVSGEVRLDQLDYEIARAHGWADGSILALDGDTLLVGHAKASADTVIQVCRNHRPDPGWFPNVEYPALSLPAIAQKAAQGGVLSDDEIQVALRALLARGEF